LEERGSGQLMASVASDVRVASEFELEVDGMWMASGERREETAYTASDGGSDGKRNDGCISVGRGLGSTS